MKKQLDNLLSPAFLIGYTALLAVIMALFIFSSEKEIALTIITILTNILTGVVTYYYTKENPTKREDSDNE